jgi:AcrR family transcriptional regulator
MISKPPSLSLQPRGRPRSARAQRAILAAASDSLYEQGLSGMNVAVIAQRAGVSKATIYRWWPSKEMLALDAFVTDWEATSPVQSPDTGSLRGDLHERFRIFWRLMQKRPLGRVLTGLAAHAQGHPAFAEVYRERFLEPRRVATRAIFQRAIDRGEIPPDADLDVALDLLYGALFHRLFQGHGPLDSHFAHEVVECVVAALEARTPAT